MQVFDDGKSTFFQFRAGEPVPAIFADTATGQQLVIPQLEGPYIVSALLTPPYPPAPDRVKPVAFNRRARWVTKRVSGNSN